MSNAERKYKPEEVTKHSVSHKHVEQRYRFKYVKDSLIPTLPDYLGFVLIAVVVWLAYFFGTALWGALVERKNYLEKVPISVSEDLKSSGLSVWEELKEDLGLSSKRKKGIESF